MPASLSTFLRRALPTVALLAGDAPLGASTVKADGSFSFQTVRPGRYDARPIVHIHVKVLTEGEPADGREHVTQLYFADDERSAAQPASARMSVAADGTAAIDIATPFARAAASEATSPVPSASPAPADLPAGLTPVAPAGLELDAFAVVDFLAGFIVII